MNHLSDGLNHRRIKRPSADYTQQKMSTLHHRHEWATRGEHTHAPDKSAVGVLDARTYNSNAQRPPSLRRLGQLGPLLAPALLPCGRRQPARRPRLMPPPPPTENLNLNSNRFQTAFYPGHGIYTPLSVRVWPGYFIRAIRASWRSCMRVATALCSWQTHVIGLRIGTGCIAEILVL